jgi:hypothetical protein
MLERLFFLYLFVSLDIPYVVASLTADISRLRRYLPLPLQTCNNARKDIGVYFEEINYIEEVILIIAKIFTFFSLFFYFLGLAVIDSVVN